MHKTHILIIPKTAISETQVSDIEAAFPGVKVVLVAGIDVPISLIHIPRI